MSTGIDYATVTAAVKTLLDDNLDAGRKIYRNAERNEDPSQAVGGWVNVMRGPADYAPHAMGSRRYRAVLRPRVEVQAASLTSAADAEDKLQDYEKEVLDIVMANPTLGGTVAMVLGIGITYEINQNEDTYHHAAIITIEAEKRT